MKLYKHQQQVVDDNFLKFGNFRGTGSGKTRSTVAIAEGVTLVICPKTQMLEKMWEKEWEVQGKTNELHVMSKEQFKKMMNTDPISPYADTLIIDEAHTVAGVTPYTRQKKHVKYPKASQIYEAVQAYINIVQPKRIHPLTATPVPQPMAMWAFGRMLGKKWDYYKWRQQFYFEQTMRGRIIYMPNRSAANKVLMDKLKMQIGYVGGISSFVDVPDQVFKEHKVSMTQQQTRCLDKLKLLYPDPLVLVGKKHQLEQGLFEGEVIKENKVEAIEQYLQEFGKLLVCAKYTAQIDHYRKHFSKSTRVFVLNGKTKNTERATMMKEVERIGNCILLVQSSIGSGWEVPSIQCVIFSSNSYSYIDRVQMEGRVQRINQVKKNIYIDLISGEIDSKVLKCVKNKQDFSEIKYINKTL